MGTLERDKGRELIGEASNYGGETGGPDAGKDILDILEVVESEEGEAGHLDEERWSTSTTAN